MARPEGVPAVCMLGHHELDYPRNRSVREALERAGFRVFLCHSRAPFPLRHLILALRLFRIRGAGWIFVTEGGHRLVPLVKLWAWLTGRKVMFDPFLSRYNTRIEDRRLHRPGGLQAWMCLWQDWSSTHAADFLVFDTLQHKEYFYRKYGLAKPWAILPVGVDEAVFDPSAAADAPRPQAFGAGGFQVFFYGTYIPLQGIEWILEAAALLKDEDVRFTLIGEGQTRSEMEARARSLALRNIAFLPPVPPEDLIPYLGHADLCLGIFGDTLKASQVVPNKVVQAAALGRPLVTRDSEAMTAWFRDGESVALVPPASGVALAAAIRRLRADPALREALGAGARRVFERGFSREALAAVLVKALRKGTEPNAGPP